MIPSKPKRDEELLAIRLQKSRVAALECEIAMKGSGSGGSMARLVEFEVAKEAEQASVKTRAFAEWYNKDMRFY